MRIAGTIWLQVLLLVAMFAFSAMVLRPELAEAASRKRGEETLTGRWSWRASCPGGQYRGAAYIAQHGINRFSGRLGNTSFYDRGSISSGRLRGRSASFILNAFGKSARINALLVVRAGSMVARGAYSSQTYGRCLLVFTKL
jgi:hypothetical protein